MASLRPSAPASWQLDRETRVVTVDGRRTRLADKPFRVLVALVEAGGRVVTRAELQRHLWSTDTFVDFDNNLNSAVATLRQVLGDSGRSPLYVETIPKTGYRLLTMPADGALADRRHAVRASPRPAGWSRWRVVAIAALVLVIIAGAVMFMQRVSRGGDDRPAGAPAAVAELQRGHYLRSQWAATHRDVDVLRRARAAFAEARRADPALAAAATAEEADTVLDLAFAGAVGFRAGLDEARALADRSLASDGESGVALRVRGLTALFLDWDVTGAGSWIARAESRLPADSRTALARATWFAATGQAGEAVRAAERAVALDPASNFVRADLALFYLAAGQVDAAAETSRRVLDVAPDFVPALANVVLAHERLGDLGPAMSAARTLLDLTSAPADVQARARLAGARDVVRLWHDWDLQRMRAAAGDRLDDYALALALRSAAAGDRDAAFEYLGRALERRDAMLVFIRAFPELAPLRSDPRFESIAGRVFRG